MSPSSSPPTSPITPSGRRPSILITDPKTRNTQNNYYKKRVSFGDILFQREYDVEGGFVTGDDSDHEDEENSDRHNRNDDIATKSSDLSPIASSPSCSDSSFPTIMTNSVLVS
jgi:hypothetical protein